MGLFSSCNGCFKVSASVIYLRKVSHYVEAFRVILRHDIEEERVCVVIQSFVVQETLSE